MCLYVRLYFVSLVSLSLIDDITCRYEGACDPLACVVGTQNEIVDKN